MRVVVVGGGPGGSVTAARLRQLGHEVVLFERETFPRFHIGESLLPKSLPVLETIGVLDAVRDRFITKYGARFHDDMTGKKDRFSFDGAWKPEPVHAFQVQRDEFDELLLSHARSLGVDVRMPAHVEHLLLEGGRAIGVVADGARVDADFVVDATGRDRLVARADGAAKIPGLAQTAFFNHYEGVRRGDGKLAGDIDIVLFDSGEPTHPNWFWLIPFKSGVTSVGAVVSPDWIRAQGGVKPSQMLERAIASSPTAQELLAEARPLWSDVQVLADYSYRVGTIRGPGWLAVGDASGFIDPLFSTGVHLAICGGLLAAEAIHEGTSAALDAWEQKVRAAAETYVVTVQAFYRGPLVAHLFAEDKHAALRRSITSLLAGDVYGDAIWLRDVRLRLAALTSSV